MRPGARTDRNEQHEGEYLHRLHTLTIATKVLGVAPRDLCAAGERKTGVLAQPPAPPVAVSFVHLPPGWRQFGQLEGSGDILATSWRYRPGPAGWARAIPRDGILVHIFFVHGTPPYPRLRLRLPHSTRFTLEDAPDVREYRISGRVLGRNVEVWTEIRRRHPTARQLRIAQSVVSALRFR